MPKRPCHVFKKVAFMQPCLQLASRAQPRGQRQTRTRSSAPSPLRCFFTLKPPRNSNYRSLYYHGVCGHIHLCRMTVSRALLLLQLVQSVCSASETSWVESFCGRYGGDMYVKVPQAFLRDPVVANSLYALVDESELFEEALKFLGGAPSRFDIGDPEHLRICERLYQAVHVRYVTSSEGLQQLRSMIEAGRFGECPRVLCRGQKLLPVGLHDKFGLSSVKGFCPLCSEVYHAHSKHSGVDGAAFGTTLPHLLLLRHSQLRPDRAPERYTPRIFGFRVRRRRDPILRGLETMS